jgi:hypothetical protein
MNFVFNDCSACRGHTVHVENGLSHFDLTNINEDLK